MRVPEQQRCPARAHHLLGLLCVCARARLYAYGHTCVTHIHMMMWHIYIWWCDTARAFVCVLPHMVPYMCPYICPDMCPYMCPDVCPYMCPYMPLYVSLYVSLDALTWVFIWVLMCFCMRSGTCARSDGLPHPRHMCPYMPLYGSFFPFFSHLSLFYMPYIFLYIYAHIHTHSLSQIHIYAYTYTYIYGVLKLQ